MESWARCRGQARFLFSMEPSHREFGLGQFVHWARDTLQDVRVVGSHEQLGCNRNTYKALAEGFSESDFVILAEEDIEVADDTLEYFTWARDKYHYFSPEVMAVCAHVKDAGGGGPRDAFRAPWFSPLVWGTWRDRWEELLEPGWLAHPDAWDGHTRTVRAERNRECVYPALSRARHFGESSTMTPRRADGAPNYFHVTALTSCFSPVYGPQDYRETRVTGATLY